MGYRVLPQVIQKAVNFHSDFKGEQKTPLPTATLSFSCTPGVARDFIMTSCNDVRTIYGAYKPLYKREVEKRPSERPVFLSMEQFQTINLNRRLNKVFEQRFKVVLSWGSFQY